MADPQAGCSRVVAETVYETVTATTRIPTITGTRTAVVNLPVVRLHPPPFYRCFSLLTQLAMCTEYALDLHRNHPWTGHQRGLYHHRRATRVSAAPSWLSMHPKLTIATPQNDAGPRVGLHDESRRHIDTRLVHLLDRLPD